MSFDKTKQAYIITQELFRKRGYNIIEKDDEMILAIKPDGNQICAFIPKTSCNFNVDYIQKIIYTLNEMDMDIKHCLIVYKRRTPVANKVIEESNQCGKIKFELFHEDELQYDLTTHKYVPKHELYYKNNTEDAKKFKKDLHPIISKIDPVSRFYDFNLGDVIKVTRKNGTVIFRIVGK